MNLIYVASAYAGDIEQNVENAKKYCVHVINEENAIPIAPHLLFTQFLDDEVPADRKLGLDLGLALLEYCDEIWVFGDVNKGMKLEIDKAKEIELPIRWFTKDLEEIMDQTRVQARMQELEAKLEYAVDLMSDYHVSTERLLDAVAMQKKLSNMAKIECLAQKWFDDKISDKRMAEAVFGLVNGEADQNRY